MLRERGRLSAHRRGPLNASIFRKENGRIPETAVCRGLPPSSPPLCAAVFNEAEIQKADGEVTSLARHWLHTLQFLPQAGGRRRNASGQNISTAAPCHPPGMRDAVWSVPLQDLPKCLPYVTSPPRPKTWGGTTAVLRLESPSQACRGFLLLDEHLFSLHGWSQSGLKGAKAFLGYPSWVLSSTG